MNRARIREIAEEATDNIDLDVGAHFGAKGIIESALLRFAEELLTQEPVAKFEAEGYALAMAVLQSDLYHKLSEKERAECDEFIHRGMHPDSSAPPVPQGMVLGFVKPDNDRQVFFYEQDHYYLSNFSAFTLDWEGRIFPTSEQAYHWERFKGTDNALQEMVRTARSAHEAFRLAQDKKAFQRSNWDSIKVGIMRDILIAKACQHEYVLRKLLQTGDKELIEDSWRDDFWGWGPNRDGQNMLGKLWMEVRAMLAAAQGGKNG